MIDFRYHAMSLAAVFVALAVGLLLGVTIGDTGLVSNVRGDLENSLKKSLNEAHDTNNQLKKGNDQQNAFINQAYPQMVENKLIGIRLGVIGSSGATRDVLKSVTNAVEPAGGRVSFAGEIVEKPRYVQLARALHISRVINPADISDKQTQKLGVAVGRRLARGKADAAMRRFVFGRLSGRISRVRFYAFARTQPDNPKSPDGSLLDGFERGIADGIARDVDREIGIEQTSTDPSNIKWYQGLGLSTVDDIDQTAGQYAFVLIMNGAKGDYGYKNTADAVIPQLAP